VEIVSKKLTERIRIDLSFGTFQSPDSPMLLLRNGCFLRPRLPKLFELIKTFEQPDKPFHSDLRSLRAQLVLGLQNRPHPKKNRPSVRVHLQMKKRIS
jgi:hypothetical protein